MSKDTSRDFFRNIVEVYLAVFASPNKICFTSAATHFVEFLVENCEPSGGHSSRERGKLTKRFTPT